jgi:hypothetical protein
MDPLRRKKATDSRLRAYREDLARIRQAVDDRNKARAVDNERRQAEARALVEARLRPWEDIPLGSR